HIEAESYNGESGTGTEACTDAGGGQNLSQMHAGDYAYYNDVHFPASGTYLVEYRVASTNASGVISADLNNGATQLGTVSVPNTGGWQSWTTVSRTVNVTAGTHRFGINATVGGWNLNWIRISKYSTLIQAENFSTMSGMGTEACTDAGGGSNLSQVHAGDWASYYDVPFPAAGTYTIDYRVASTNGGGVIRADILNGLVLGSVSVPNTGGWQNWTTVSHTVNVTQGGFHRLGIEATVGGWNLNWIRVTRKGKQLEAENYTNMSGVNTQTCTDFGGGQNMSHIDAGDWAYYSNVSFPASGTYTIEYRVASLSGGGTLEADLNIGATVFPQVAVPATGGWQSWTTVSQSVTVTAGTHRFGVKAVAGGWNLNWIRISKTGGGAAAAGAEAAAAEEQVALYPNPAQGELFLRFSGAGASGRVINAAGQTVLTLPSLTSGGPVDVSSLRGGVYILEMVVDGRRVTKRFVKR
ncbi:carbohydrate-binding protein, partial [Rufibacter roseus]